MNQAQIYRVRMAAVQGFLAVCLGAFGAHGLKKLLVGLPPEEATKRLSWVATGARYQLVHAAALLALAALEGGAKRNRNLERAGFCFFYGPLLFAATLYAMALGAPLWLGAVTPIGGLLMIVGWALLGFSASLSAGRTRP
ncbi:MAG: DUF423 domain-containing protein [bacterium]